MSWRSSFKPRTARWLAIAALLLSASCYVVLVAPLPFVASWWHAGEANWSDAYKRRNRMADAFLLTNRLIGMPRAQVVALLGEPPSTEYFKNWNIVYNLGAERGLFAIDSEWLVMRTDSQGRVIQAAIVRD
jgi:hypothetical protein